MVSIFFPALGSRLLSRGCSNPALATLSRQCHLTNHQRRLSSLQRPQLALGYPTCEADHSLSGPPTGSAYRSEPPKPFTLGREMLRVLCPPKATAIPNGLWAIHTPTRVTARGSGRCAGGIPGFRPLPEP